MQKTPWFCERQADVMLNYLPLRNVLTQGINAMVKTKALPDPAAPPIWSLFLSPSQTWPYQGWSTMSSLSLADTVHPEGTPWILPRLYPGKIYYVIQLSQKPCDTDSPLPLTFHRGGS